MIPLYLCKTKQIISWNRVQLLVVFFLFLFFYYEGWIPEAGESGTELVGEEGHVGVMVGLLDWRAGGSCSCLVSVCPVPAGRQAAYNYTVH